jgi:hypothetical protein
MRADGGQQPTTDMTAVRLFVLDSSLAWPGRAGMAVPGVLVDLVAL